MNILDVDEHIRWISWMKILDEHEFLGYLWVYNKSFAYYSRAEFMQISKIALIQLLS